MNKHGHPLIHMRGLSSENLSAVLDFIYYGEATISQTNLDSFLVVAEQLQLKGLIAEEAENNANESKPQYESAEDIFEKNMDEVPTEMFDRKLRGTTKQFSADGNCKFSFSADSSDLPEIVKSMMEKTEKVITRKVRGKFSSMKASVCKQCGKEGAYTTILDHIEANHITGICLPCNLCDTTCTSRSSLRWHKKKYHSN